LQRLKGRDGNLTPERVVSFDAFGIKKTWLSRRARSRRELFQVQAQYGKEFCEYVVEKGLDGADAIYALNTAARELFAFAKRRKIFCIMEQTIAPRLIERRLDAEEAERWPGWDPRVRESPGSCPLSEREMAELTLADCIICGSEFVANSLRSILPLADKCCVIPYGVDSAMYVPATHKRDGRQLNVLFVGAIGLRKGVPYLLEALRLLDSSAIQCRLVGKLELDIRCLAPYAGRMEIVGPLPRSATLAMYHWADVLVLPSICEGSATVTYEALACGLPVIATPNTGSIVRSGKDGFIVPIRDSYAIASSLERLLSEPNLLHVMANHALERGREFDLTSYSDRLVQYLISAIRYSSGGQSLQSGGPRGLQ
jgi:glycosyltransferase involved in cell wall biosynthesis